MLVHQWIQKLRTATFVMLGIGLTTCKHSDSGPSALREAETYETAGLALASLVSANPGVEAATTAGLIAAIKKGITGARDAHPKAHGCFDNVELKVNSDIPVSLQNELFTPNRTYQTAIRLSHGASSKTASDLVNDLHGFALKIFLDESFTKNPPISAKLPLVDPTTREVVGQLDINELQLSEQQGVGARYYHSVDIVTINALHEFMVDGLADYRDFFAAGGILKELIPSIIQNRGKLPVALSNPALTPALTKINPLIQQGPNYQLFVKGELSAQEMPKLIVELKNVVFDVVFHQARGGQSGAIAKLTYAANGHRTWDALQSSYQSFVPYRYGGSPQASEGPAVKYQIAAVDCTTKKTLDVDNLPQPPAHVQPFLVNPEKSTNYLGAVLASQVAKKDHCFALRAQAWEKGFPSLDSASGVWGNQQYVNIAELKIPQGSAMMVEGKCEKLSFNPGHGPAEFQGAGQIQRSRRLIYAAIETLRNEQNMQPSTAR